MITVKSNNAKKAKQERYFWSVSEFYDIGTKDKDLRVLKSRFQAFFQQVLTSITAQKMKFSIRDFLSECDQIRSFQRIWSYLLKTKSNDLIYAKLFFCAKSLKSLR